MEATQYQLIEKEAVAGLHFPEVDVLTTKEEKAQRNADLQMAMSLGNLEHSKIKIYFEDDTSPKVVDTTVWGLTDKRVILKQGLVIPIHRITRIKF
ncbi:MAG: hypothetical protein K0S33_848 [Bacteroidetes bacterium]|jgi:hypothetical protein|nr:hypothetical protein [Bacteroidota bacterium]